MVTPMSDVFVFCWTSKSVGQMVTRKTDGFRKIERFSCHALSTSKYLFSLSTVIELFNDIDSENSYRSKANRADFFLINIEHFFEQFHGVNNICAL